jgi:hypothetical protein
MFKRVICHWLGVYLLFVLQRQLVQLLEACDSLSILLYEVLVFIVQ